jgi:hypothetical protein
LKVGNGVERRRLRRMLRVGWLDTVGRRRRGRAGVVGVGVGVARGGIEGIGIARGARGDTDIGLGVGKGITIATDTTIRRCGGNEVGVRTGGIEDTEAELPIGDGLEERIVNPDETLIEHHEGADPPTFEIGETGGRGEGNELYMGSHGVKYCIDVQLAMAFGVDMVSSR